MPDFGSTVDPLVNLAELAKRYRGRNGYELQIVLREEYAVSYGITDLDDSSKPLALIAVSAGDGNRQGMSRYTRMREFKAYEVNKHYGLSFTEFLDMSSEDVRQILNILKDDIEKQNRELEIEQKRLKNKSNGYPFDV